MQAIPTKAYLMKLYSTGFRFDGGAALGLHRREDYLLKPFPGFWLRGTQLRIGGLIQKQSEHVWTRTYASERRKQATGSRL